MVEEEERKDLFARYEEEDLYPIFILGETREQIVSLLGTENNI